MNLPTEHHYSQPLPTVFVSLIEELALPRIWFQCQTEKRIYPENEPIPADHSPGRQRHECSLIVPVYELEREASIKNVVETTDDPFDSAVDFLGIDSRKSRKKRKLDDYDYIDDEDLKRELRKG